MNDAVVWEVSHHSLKSVCETVIHIQQARCEDFRLRTKASESVLEGVFMQTLLLRLWMPLKRKNRLFFCGEQQLFLKGRKEKQLIHQLERHKLLKTTQGLMIGLIL